MEALNKVREEGWAVSKQGEGTCVPGCAAPFRGWHRPMARPSLVFRLRTWTFTLGGENRTENTQTIKQICTYTNDAEKKCCQINQIECSRWLSRPSTGRRAAPWLATHVKVFTPCSVIGQAGFECTSCNLKSSLLEQYWLAWYERQRDEGERETCFFFLTIC